MYLGKLYQDAMDKKDSSRANRLRSWRDLIMQENIENIALR
jgi:hypothetical protein